MINKSKIVALAQKYAGKGQFEKAVVEYQKVLKEDPNDIRTWLKMGDLYTRMGARSEATDTYLKVAAQYRKTGFHLKAVAVYKQIIRLDPLKIDVYELLADAYLSLGLTSEALIQYEKLVDVSQRQNKQHLLLETLEKIVSLDKTNVVVRLKFAEQLSLNQMNKDAILHFSIVCDHLLSTGRIDDYLKVADRLLYLEPSNVAFAKKTASLYLEKNEPKRALAKLQGCFAQNKNDREVLELLVEAFNQLGQSEKAVSVLSELIKISAKQNDPEGTQKYNKQIKALKAGKQEISATVALAEKRDSYLPSPASVTTAIADQRQSAVSRLLEETDVLIKYGLMDRAKEHLEKIFTLDYYNLDARELMKDILHKEGNIEGAKNQLFILVDAFSSSQPEGAVYYLHKVFEIDPYSKRAREKIEKIGGVLPEGLPVLTPENTNDQSGLLESRELESGEIAVGEELEISINDLPYIEDETMMEGSQDSEEEAQKELYATNAQKRLPTAPPPPPPPPPMQVSNNLPKPSIPPVLAGLPRPSMLPSLKSSPPLASKVDNKTVSSDEKIFSTVLPLNKKEEKTEDNKPTVQVNIDDEIEEIEFFLEQGLLKEAYNIFDALIAQYPNNSALKKLKLRFDKQKKPADSGKIVITQKETLGLDELSDSLQLNEMEQEEAFVNVDVVFSQFKAGVEEQISKSDHNTHYDLGQAYKEMGLWDDAIGEFKLAAGDIKKKAAAEMMVGMCHVGAARFEKALEEFESALKKPDLLESERLALMYEKAKVFELLNNNEIAIELYNEILNTDPGFADVVERIDSLE